MPAGARSVEVVQLHQVPIQPDRFERLQHFPLHRRVRIGVAVKADDAEHVLDVVRRRIVAQHVSAVDPHRQQILACVLLLVGSDVGVDNRPAIGVGEMRIAPVIRGDRREILRHRKTGAQRTSGLPLRHADPRQKLSGRCDRAVAVPARGIEGRLEGEAAAGHLFRIERRHECEVEASPVRLDSRLPPRQSARVVEQVDERLKLRAVVFRDAIAQSGQLRRRHEEPRVIGADDRRRGVSRLRTRPGRRRRSGGRGRGLTSGDIS